MPCGLSGVLGKPEFMLRHLRPNAVADLGVWEERLDCESFYGVAYTIGRFRVVGISMAAASGGANDEQVPLRIARRMTEAWGPPDTLGVQAGVENGRAVVLEWHWKDARTLGAIRRSALGRLRLLVLIARAKLERRYHVITNHPDIVRALVSGRYPPELTPARLLSVCKDLPHDWQLQRTALGFETR